LKHLKIHLYRCDNDVSKNTLTVVYLLKKLFFWGFTTHVLIRVSLSMRIRYDEMSKAIKSGPSITPVIPMTEIPPRIPIIIITE